MKRFLKALKRQINHYFASSKSSEPAEFIEVERCERIFYLNYLREGMTVFDVGANVGELTLLFSRFVGDGGSVHAFEAGSEVFKSLKLICETTQRRNVVMNHLALSDTNGTIKLNIYDTALSVFNSQAARPLKNYGLEFEAVGVEETSAITIDDYCQTNNIKNIDLLKIDVEGAELQVLRGARRMLTEKRIKCVTFEFGQTTFDIGNSAADLKIFFSEVDYKVSNIVESNSLFPGGHSVETARYSMHKAIPN